MIEVIPFKKTHQSGTPKTCTVKKDSKIFKREYLRSFRFLKKWNSIVIITNLSMHFLTSLAEGSG